MPATKSGAPESDSVGSLAGAAVGVLLVLLAVLLGTIGQRFATTGPGAGPGVAAVAETGDTTRVEIVAEAMRFQPDHIEVPAGDRLVIELVNRGGRKHDLVLENGAGTPPVQPGETATLDAGVIIAPLEGWCSVFGHRQAGMELSVSVVDRR